MVLYFYPKDDTPGCTEQACKFRDDFAVLKILGAEVLGISVDDHASHVDFARKHKPPFPLLSDKDGNVASAYGSLRDLLITRIAKRNTFLINPQGALSACIRARIRRRIPPKLLPPAPANRQAISPT